MAWEVKILHGNNHMVIKKNPKNIPKSPGIYKMIDKEGKIIYIGKAKNLNKRVKQYFQKNYQHSTRTKKLLENVEKIDCIIVDSELEAILLETNLIKQFYPKYNVLMKDDKNFVYIKITNEDFPRIQIVRKVLKDNAFYIGPKTAAHKLTETFKVLKKIFPFRHCNLNIKSLGGNKVEIKNKTIKFPCLDYYIKRCIAPCIGNCTKEEYGEIIKGIKEFLKGKGEIILKTLRERMQLQAQNKEFEKAAKTRDKILKIQNILEKQKISDPNQEDKDIINYFIANETAYFNLFQIRDGKLIGQENFILTAKNIEPEMNEEKIISPEKKEILSSFINQYYELATDIPKEILIPHEIENTNKTLKIIIPKIGVKNKLLEMSLKNAQIFADRNKPSWQEESEITKNAVKKLQKLLKLKNPLKRIECYDISHLSGTDTVGSMIVFKNGIPDKSMYRKFKLRTIEDKPDDCKSMEEVLTRRFLKISQDIQHKDFIFKKAREFYILEKNKKTVGSIALKIHNEKIAELTNLWISPKERGEKLGYKLIKNAIQKTKPKRIYILSDPKLKEYYSLIGFEEIKIIPKELKSKRRQLCMVYDKIKHKPDKSFSQIPDLVVIDGGKGQLSSASEVFKKLNFKIPFITLSKKLEEIYIPHEKNSIILPQTSETLKLLQRARDEAHRFAINYNQKLRSKKFSSSNK